MVPWITRGWEDGSLERLGLGGCSSPLSLLFSVTGISYSSRGCQTLGLVWMYGNAIINFLCRETTAAPLSCYSVTNTISYGSIEIIWCSDMAAMTSTESLLMLSSQPAH